MLSAQCPQQGGSGTPGEAIGWMRSLLQLLRRTHLSQLLGIVLSCFLHGQLGVNGDHLAVGDRQPGEQVGLKQTEAQHHQQKHTACGGMGLAPMTTWILQVRT